MNLEQLGTWVESAQYRKILNILEQAPTVVQQLRQFGILKQGTAEEIQAAVEQGTLAFEPQETESSGQYTAFIREGGNILAQIPWEQLSANLNAVSVSTLALSLHNAVMLHKISAQLMEMDAKLDSILLGQQTDREADCKSAMSLLEQAKLYNGKDDELKKNLISNALQSASKGYESILPHYLQAIEKVKRMIGGLYCVEHVEDIYDNPFISFGAKLLNSKLGCKLFKFGASFTTDQEMQETADLLNASASVINPAIEIFHQQWNYLYLATSVIVFAHLLLENQKAANRALEKFYQEVLAPVLFPAVEDIDEIEDVDERITCIALSENEKYLEVYNQHIEQFKVFEELYVEGV